MDFSKMSRNELREQCRTRGIRRYSLMTNEGMRANLVEFDRQREQQPQPVAAEPVAVTDCDRQRFGGSCVICDAQPQPQPPNALPTIHAQRVRRLSDQIHIRDGKRPIFKRAAYERALRRPAEASPYLLERNGFAVLPSNGRTRAVPSSKRTQGRIKRAFRRDVQRIARATKARELTAADGMRGISWAGPDGKVYVRDTEQHA